MLIAVLAAACGDADTAPTTVATGSGGTAPPVAVDGQPTTTAAPSPTTATPVAEPVAVFDVVEVHDPMINDFLALTLLVPPGWTRQGGIVWEPDLYPLAGAALTLTDPTGAYALETYFTPSFSWIDDPLYQNPGMNWLGSIMAPPRSAEQALVDIVLPQIRPGAQAVAAVPLDTSGMEGTTDGIRLRVRYGGTEEDFVAVTFYSTNPALGTTFYQWGFQVLYSMRAPLGALDAVLPDLEMIAGSVQIDPLWYANYLTVVDLFIQRGYESIRLAGELSDFITRTYDEISRIHRETWENQQRTYDRLHENFIDYIRETQRVNPSGGGGGGTGGPGGNGGTRRVPAGVACQRPDGGITVLPDGSTCPPGWTFLPPVT